MKIFYAIQATGNGHIARAMELMPFLQQHGEVDIFLSGSNNSLNIDLPVKYRSKGLSLFYGNNGGLDYWKIAKTFAPVRIIKEAKNLPLEKYDVVFNDFEIITSLACKLKKVPFVHFGHQASFASAKTPMPSKKDWLGEYILKNYASSPHNIGLHFESYDQDIYNPIIKQSILDAVPTNQGHITVYLSHYSDEVVIEQLSKVKELLFHVFSKKVKQETRIGNVLLKPVGNETFNQSMIASAGIITGAGFETPAEALYMNKKLMCLPILGQYEQLCNAEALLKFNVPIVDRLDEHFSFKVKSWMNGLQPKAMKLDISTAGIVELAIDKALSLKQQNEPAFDFKELINPSDIVFPLPNYSV
jgi:uncharacterized protein (TIGR00661 family)